MVLEKAMKKYQGKMKAIEFPLPDAYLEKAHNEAADLAREIFDDERFGSDGEAAKIPLEEALEKVNF